MKIYFDTKHDFFSDNNKHINNCVTVKDDKKLYHYEFMIDGLTATIRYNKLDYITHAVDFYHDKNPYIYIYKTEDDTYYQAFEEIHTFKLPIDILQPTKFFIDKSNYDLIEKNIDVDNEFYFPVNIINDEYVLLDGHTLLSVLANNYKKMVNVYIVDYEPEIIDFIYIAKEQNIRNIKSVNILKHEEYEKLWNMFLNEYNEKIDE